MAVILLAWSIYIFSISYLLMLYLQQPTNWSPNNEYILFELANQKLCMSLTSEFNSQVYDKKQHRRSPILNALMNFLFLKSHAFLTAQLY